MVNIYKASRYFPGTNDEGDWNTMSRANHVEWIKLEMKFNRFLTPVPLSPLPVLAVPALQRGDVSTSTTGVRHLTRQALPLPARGCRGEAENCCAVCDRVRGGGTGGEGCQR